MRVLKFYIMLLVSFIILCIFFNRSILTYIEQKYHISYQPDIAFFDKINIFVDKFLSISDIKLDLDLFELIDNKGILENLSEDGLKYTQNNDAFFINFNNSKKANQNIKDNGFSMYEFVVKYHLNRKTYKKQNSIELFKNNQTSDIWSNFNKNTQYGLNIEQNNKIKINPNEQYLLIGDSLMQGTGTFIIKELKQGGVKAKNIAKQSTGLAYKKFYNWQEELNKILKEDKYSGVVVLLGTNDYWDMINPQNKSKYLKFGTEEWDLLYSSRVKEIINEAKNKNVKLFWYQLPAINKPSLDQKIKHLSNIIQNTISQENYGVFIKTDDTFGEFQAYIKNEEGKKTRARSNDGIHFTPYGYSLMAKKLLNYIELSTEDEKNN